MNAAQPDGCRLVLTLSPSEGTYLIALVALFVSTAMGHAWGILSFVLHQFRSTKLPRSGLYHQQQTLLSNALPSSVIFWSLLRMAWRWRSKNPTAARNSMGLTLAALLHFILLTATSILSSRLLSAGSEVLVRGSSCGMFAKSQRNISVHPEDGPNYYIATLTYAQHTALATLKYAQDCYNNNNTTRTNSDICQSFTTPAISYIRQNKRPCLFSTDICAVPEALEIDTGYADSNYNLGINTPGSSRLLFRKVISCIPTLVEEKYSTNWTTERPDFMLAELPEGDWYKYYKIGPAVSQFYTWVVQKSSFWDIQPSSPYQIKYVFHLL